MLARANGAQIRHCGTVFGGLPAISIAERDLAGAVIERLEAQANSLSVGVGTNWTTVSDSAATNQMSLPIDPSVGGAFFRLVYP